MLTNAPWSDVITKSVQNPFMFLFLLCYNNSYIVPIVTIKIIGGLNQMNLSVKEYLFDLHK